MTFSHLDDSTTEDAWVRAGALSLRHLSAGDFAEGGTVLVLSAHPDDEAFGAASLLSRTHDWACDVTLLLFTAGEKSHPHSPTHTHERLKQVRLQEFDAALALLNPSVSSRFLEFEDGTLADRRDQVLQEILAELSAAHGPITIVAPYSGDGHADHETLGEAAVAAGREYRARVLEYPIWYWHWANPADSTWRSWSFLPDPEGLDKQEVIECYISQTQSLSQQSGDEAILSPAQLAHLDRGGDTFKVTNFTGTGFSTEEPGVAEEPGVNDAHTASRVFDDVHIDRSDPWAVRDSEYEITKRATLLAHLPRISFSHTLEIGCSIGVLSEELAGLSERVTAVDASRQALNIAARLRSGASGVSYVRATVPFEWPEGRFDCVVLSETGFYLSRTQLQQTLQRIDQSTTDTFVLVLCHWTGEILDWPLNADEVHERCLSFWPHHRVEFHAEAKYRLDILTVTKPPTAPGPVDAGRADD
ncbi:PIG-L family deacetylase [Brevibacterium sp. CBA3109]|uniref:PIG-L family deacetylase n=1 Tax=Brevibacterium koreense TaxID=3140787 RepID=A0AAU7UMG3_9MICO